MSLLHVVPRRWLGPQDKRSRRTEPSAEGGKNKKVGVSGGCFEVHLCSLALG